MLNDSNNILAAKCHATVTKWVLGSLAIFTFLVAGGYSVYLCLYKGENILNVMSFVATIGSGLIAIAPRVIAHFARPHT
jgi:hypothetical protein